MLGIRDITGTVKRVITMANNRVDAATNAQQAHRQNIQRSLEHRLEVARAKGDEKLIRQLEDEMKHLG